MNTFTSMSALLDELSPDLPASGPGWDDVLKRAELVTPAAQPTRPRPRRRRVTLALALLAAVAVPLVALAAVNDWWFFQFASTPRPVAKPVVVTQGSWSGHPWSLVAYNSKTHGTCWSITFESSPSGGAGGFYGTYGAGSAGATSGADNALGCGGIVGLRPPDARALQLPTVMYISGFSFNTDYPNWIAGPVVASAKTVLVRYRNGVVLRMATTRQVQLGKVGWYGTLRFFAGQLPHGVHSYDLPLSITGLSASGNVVACFVPSTALPDGSSPLTNCRR